VKSGEKKKVLESISRGKMLSGSRKREKINSLKKKKEEGRGDCSSMSVTISSEKKKEAHAGRRSSNHWERNCPEVEGLGTPIPFSAQEGPCLVNGHPSSVPSKWGRIPAERGESSSMWRTLALKKNRGTCNISDRVVPPRRRTPKDIHQGGVLYRNFKGQGGESPPPSAVGKDCRRSSTRGGPGGCHPRGKRRTGLFVEG